MNEGASLTAIPVEVAVLVCWAVIPFLLAVRLFKWN